MPQYCTKQREALLSYLAAHADEQLSVKCIAEELKDKSISISALYRNLSRLEEEGKVRRSSKGGSREVFYQYTDAEPCRECLHLCCKSCGRTFHMETKAASQLMEQVAKTNEFTIDKAETVIYGTCEKCSNT